MLNVLHVLEFKKNLVSTSFLYKNGFKIILKFDKLILSKIGVFVGKDYSYKGMFKLNLDNNKVCPNSVYIVDFFFFMAC